MTKTYDHIGVDTAYHCKICGHHHCLKCGLCHRCGCEKYVVNIKERKNKRREQKEEFLESGR